VLKKTAGEALIHAIRIVASSGTYIEPSLIGGVVERAYRGSGMAQQPRDLSPREEEVLIAKK
jgi:DNA-binding NarL/FixJ family response regulator